MDWLSSPIATLIGLLAGLIGLILTIVFYFKSKRDKEPYWSIWTIGLFKNFSSTVEGLEAQYLGEKVKDLSISNVIFWNHGRLTINQSDLTEADPLRLELKGNRRILNATVLAVNNHASRPLLGAPMGNRVLVNFDYLDRGHGFVMRVIHEGASSGDLELKGVLKGVAEIKGFDWSSMAHPKQSDYVSIFVGLSGLMGCAGWWYWSGIDDEFLTTLRIVLGATMLFLFLCLFVLTWSTFFRYSWLPRGLESFSAGPVQVDNKAKT